MAETCIFCGKKLTLFGGYWTMTCGGVSQPVCGGCYEPYLAAPPMERARLALETGRAREPERIQAFLEEEPKRLQAEREDRTRRGERQRAVLTCCGQEMKRLEGTFSFLDQTPFALVPASAPALYLFRCELCGQVKIFDASFFQEEPPDVQQPEPEEPPVRPEPVRPTRLKPGQKPPWEK